MWKECLFLILILLANKKVEPRANHTGMVKLIFDR
jgi:hypothetical protein